MNNNIATYNPIDGRVFLDSSFVNPIQKSYYLSHEILYASSFRSVKLLNDSIFSVRGGYSMSFDNGLVRGSWFDEAVIEELNKNIFLFNWKKPESELGPNLVKIINGTYSEERKCLKHFLKITSQITKYSEDSLYEKTFRGLFEKEPEIIEIFSKNYKDGFLEYLGSFDTLKNKILYSIFINDLKKYIK